MDIRITRTFATATTETWLGAKSHVVVTAVGAATFLLGAPVLYFLVEPEIVMQEIGIYLALAVAGLFAYIALVFLLNLWLTPYRLIAHDLEKELADIRQELLDRTYTPERLAGVEAKAEMARNNAMNSLDLMPRIQALETHTVLLTATARLVIFRKACDQIRAMLAEHGDTTGVRDTLNMQWLYPNKIVLVAEGNTLAEKLDATERAFEKAAMESASAFIKKP